MRLLLTPPLPLSLPLSLSPSLPPPSPSSKVLKAEQEKDKLSMGCERLEAQCQQHKAREARLVEEHTKTLERVNELWRQKWPYTWDEVMWRSHIVVGRTDVRRADIRC